MSMNSINTNYVGFVALQNLTETTKALRQTQDRISTGRTISSSRDNGAIWAIPKSAGRVPVDQCCEGLA
jgi:flagellin